MKTKNLNGTGKEKHKRKNEIRYREAKKRKKKNRAYKVPRTTKHTDLMIGSLEGATTTTTNRMSLERKHPARKNLIRGRGDRGNPQGAARVDQGLVRGMMSTSGAHILLFVNQGRLIRFWTPREMIGGGA
jgi:hypothetical protein